ncbi:MAG: hypothetical protein ABFC56_15620, partial [Clostridiaceae bacterium]
RNSISPQRSFPPSSSAGLFIFLYLLFDTATYMVLLCGLILHFYTCSSKQQDMWCCSAGLFYNFILAV